MDIFLEKKLKRLEDGIALLEEQLISMKRHYEDLLNNLDEDNFSANYKVQQGNMYSKIEQTAEKIETEVSALWEENENRQGDISRITQTATDITSLVMKMFAPAKTTTKNPLSDSSELDKNSLYLYGNNVFCYDDVLEEWRLIKDVTVSSSLKQTAFGFTINGNVRISGDVIVGGEITSTDFITSGGNSDLKLSGGAMTITETGNGNLQDYVFSLALSDSEHTDLGAYQVNIQSKDDAAFLNFKKKVNFSDATVIGLYAVFE